MAASVIYNSAAVYRFVMRVLYGRHYRDRYAAVASMVDSSGSVTDVCCGDCALAGYVPSSVRYTGVDLSDAFVRSAQARSISARRLDVVRDLLPVADCVVMMGSLYQFIPEHAAMVRHMLAAARSRVIILEPVRSLATSRFRLVRLLAAHAADAGTGPIAHRFTEVLARFP
jgi:trans-aconitate methyltransferase